jgi:hypothetical protein
MVKRVSVVQTNPQVVVSRRLAAALETVADILEVIREQAAQGRPVASALKTLQSAVRDARGLEQLLPAQPAK